MQVLSIDLAYRHHRDIGVVLLSDRAGALEARFLKVALQGTPQPDALAEYFANLADDLGAAALLIDGPQAWKDPDNGLQHSRVCERELNTPAKTGLPGAVKPANYLPFVQFSIAFFDELEARGWPRYRAGAPTTPVAIETFPLAAWRSLGLRTLPAKAKASALVIRQATDALLSLFPTRLTAEPNHDELQALVTSYVGFAVIRGTASEVRLAGTAPFRLDGTYREGFIACPRAAPRIDR